MESDRIPDVRCQAYLAPGGQNCLLEDGHDGDHVFVPHTLDRREATCPDVIPDWMLKETA